MALLLVSQFVIYALAWVVGGVIVREERRPIALWSLYCLLQAVGLYLVIASPIGANPVPLAATMLMLVSYACAVVGVDMFIHQGRPQFLRLWLMLLGLGEAMQMAVPMFDLPRHLQAVGYNLIVATLLAGPVLVLQRAMRREFGLWGLLPAVPGGLVCVLALVRCGAILHNPTLALQTSLRFSENPTMLLTTLFAAGAFNVSFLSLVMGRMVKRMHGLLDMDALTGLANRGGLEKRLASSWAHASRNGLALSVAFIDIDNFKRINDAGGHEAGDEVIRGVAAALLHSARQTDHVGRWGGDEFMLVMPHTNPEAADHATQRLLERVREAGIQVPPGCQPLTLSIGIATRERGDATVQALVTRADSAMYGSKRQRSSMAGAPISK